METYDFCFATENCKTVQKEIQSSALMEPPLQNKQRLLMPLWATFTQGWKGDKAREERGGEIVFELKVKLPRVLVWSEMVVSAWKCFVVCW